MKNKTIDNINFVRDRVKGFAILTREEEVSLAISLKSAKVDAWKTLLADPESVGLRLELCSAKSAEFGYRRSDLNEASFDRLRAAHIRAVNYTSEFNDEELGIAIAETSAAISEYDCYMEIAASIIAVIPKAEERGRARSAKSFIDENAGRMAYAKYVRIRNIFMEKNIRLVIKASRKFHTNEIPRDDLVQEGVIGLSKAVEKFDPERGVRFSSYAIWWINAYISRYRSDQCRVVKVPVRVQRDIRRAFFNPQQRQEDSDSPPQGHHTGVSLQPHIRLVDQDSFEERKRLGYGPAVEKVDTSMMEHAGKLLDARSISVALQSLTARQAYIIKSRFGLDNTIPKTLQEIGWELSLSRERVRQLESIAINILRGSVSGMSA